MLTLSSHSVQASSLAFSPYLVPHQAPQYWYLNQSSDTKISYLTKITHQKRWLVFHDHKCQKDESYQRTSCSCSYLYCHCLNSSTRQRCQERRRYINCLKKVSSLPQNTHLCLYCISPSLPLSCLFSGLYFSLFCLESCSFCSFCFFLRFCKASCPLSTILWKDQRETLIVNITCCLTFIRTASYDPHS